jgi:MFS family permease
VSRTDQLPTHGRATEQRRIRRVLVATQVLGGLGVGAGVTVTTLLAFELSGSAALAGLAASASALGAGLAAAAIGATARYGRRPGLVGGYLVGLVGAAIAVLAAVVGSFPLMLLATLAFGSSNASNLQARYAVTDLARPERRAGDLSLVVWATTVGAVLGPNLTGPGAAAARLIGVPELGGPYLLSAAGFLAAALLMLVGLRPDPLLTARADARTSQPEEADPAAQRAVHLDVADVADVVDVADVAPARREGLRAALDDVVTHPTARAATASIAASHAVMVGVMVMTPVHMGHYGADITLIGLTISLHIAGMYAFSPLFGRLADRFGAHTVLGLGYLQMLGAVGFAAVSTPRGGLGFHLGLFLLGTGWSSALIASSALLTSSLPLAARAPAQGLSDLIMNVAGAAAGALSGLIMTLIGFRLMSATTLLLLLGPALLVVVDARARRVAAAVAAPVATLARKDPVR